MPGLDRQNWDEGQVDTRQEWILEVDLKLRGVHVPAIDPGVPKAARQQRLRQEEQLLPEGRSSSVVS